MRSNSRSSRADSPTPEPGDRLDHLIGTPLQPLPDRWRDARQAADIAHARGLHDQGADRYWEWVAHQQRWSQPWETLRQGDLGDFRYFAGGLINVSDNCLDRWADDPSTATKRAVVWEGEPGETRTVSYRELRDETRRLAGGLRALGVGKGDVVAIYMTNLVEAFTAIHACHRIGAIHTILFSGFGQEAVAARLTMAAAKVVIVADAIYRRGWRVDLLATLRRARTSAPSVQHVVVVDRTGESPPLRESEVSYSDLVAGPHSGADPLPLDPNDASFLIFTSGTEAQPKGLVHSVGGFLLGTWANVKWQIGPTGNDVFWVAADVGWLTFPIQAVVGGLAHGLTIVCYEGALNTPTTDRFYEICERHDVTKVLAAPTLLRMLRSFGDDLAAAHPLPALRLVTVQGEPLDTETFAWATTLGGGVPVVNAYGQTETGSTWCYPVYGVDDLKPGSCGRPVPGHCAEVVDEHGKPAPPGTKGELVLTAPFPTLARTIWGDHDRYGRSYFQRYPGTYNTNDEAVFDDDGHVWVLGRADEVINVAAHRLSTMEIESAITAHGTVVEAAVVGVPDHTKGTVPVAFVSLRPGSDSATVLPALQEEVERAIGGIARVEAFYVTATLPKTRTGKVMRRLLRDIVTTGAPADDISALDDIEALAAVQESVSLGPWTRRST